MTNPDERIEVELHGPGGFWVEQMQIEMDKLYYG